MNKKLLVIKEKIADASKLSPLQAGKKIAAAENILNDAIELVADIDYRLEQVEQVLSLSNLEQLINGGDDEY
ncbi:hypothetical protein FHG08_11555 [Pseudoalteromonas sp. Scap03]|uniref:hypothetical protein n=1 Tax=unclassified Pseudoalteromonas TaxID=194690 RepID=UPI0015BFCB41|nr:MULTISPECIES: hypothetical protein [unclassified Pseudoalteromonas]NWL16327.1 hypothetical protein [Pseudoalteromonas sp. Scap03]QLE81445.1 hypothetical protein FLM54_07810 [Pseudoalteromonas sp. Scap25]QLE89389.1 hypothetical protein FLM47_07805 [Pseudoalteromonas sp. Scap06]